MRVSHVMSRHVAACRPDDTLHAAAQIMWDHDCGAVPVVDYEHRVIAMVTDRDICMATYTQGRAPQCIPVASAMSRVVFVVRPEDAVTDAMRLMRINRVRRLPVVDGDGKLVGLISITDLIREAERQHHAKSKQLTRDDIAITLAGIGTPHNVPPSPEHTPNVTFGTSIGSPTVPSLSPHITIPGGH